MLFPQLTVTGGPALAGVEILVSDAATVANASIMVDAQALAGDADIITLDASQTTSLQMDTAPDSPPLASTNLISLWQGNQRALRAERYFGAVVARSSGIASMNY